MEEMKVIKEHPETANHFKKTTSKAVTNGYHKYTRLKTMKWW